MNDLVGVCARLTEKHGGLLESYFWHAVGCPEIQLFYDQSRWLFPVELLLT